MSELKGRPDQPEEDPEIPQGFDRPERKYLSSEPVDVVKWEELFDNEEGPDPPIGPVDRVRWEDLIDDDGEPDPPTLDELTETPEDVGSRERARRGLYRDAVDVVDGLREVGNNYGDLVDPGPRAATVGEPKGPVIKAPEIHYGWGDSLVGLVSLAVVSARAAQRATEKLRDRMKGDQDGRDG